MTSRTILAAVIAIAAGACSAGTAKSGWQTNDEIPAALRADMLKRADAFLAAVRAGDAPATEAFLSSSYRRELASKPEIEMVALVRSIVGAAERSVELQHFVPTNDVGTYSPTIVIFKPKPYSLTLPQMNGESYVLLLAFERETSTTALELVYAKDGADWKLQLVDGGTLAVGGKRADAWFAEAKAFDAKGALIPESVRLAAGMQCLRPVPALEYGFEDDFTAHARGLIEKVEAKIKFPVTLAGPSKPTVYRIDAGFDGKELVPLIHAQTSIPIDDKAALDADTARIEKELFSLLPGLCDGVSQYAIRWYVRPPVNPTRNYRRYNAARPCPTGG